MNYSTGNQTCYHSLESPTPVSIFIKNRDKVHKTWIFKNSKDWLELRQGIDSKKIPRKVRPLAITTCSHPKCSKKNIWLLDSYWSEGWFLYIHSSPKKTIHKWYWNLHMISQPSGTNPVTISPNFSRSHSRSIRVNPPPSRQEKRLLKKKNSQIKVDGSDDVPSHSLPYP